MISFTTNRSLMLLLVSILLIVPLKSVLNAQSFPLLDEAESALFYGDYELAISKYMDALNDQSTVCQALYGLGVTHLRASQYEESDPIFTRYLDECETNFEVLVMRGIVRQALGHPVTALNDYQQAMDLRPGLLDSYLYERMAVVDPDQGIYYLRLATESPRDPESKLSLHETLTEVYLLVGSVEQAIEQYELILREIDLYRTQLEAVKGGEFDKDGNLRARIEYTLAQTELDNNNLQAGYEHLQHIITNYAETDSALPALIDLIVNGQPVDLLIRMRINVSNENYFPIVDVLVDYLNDSATSQDAPIELFLLLGEAQIGMGNYEAALDTFNRVTIEFPDSPEASTAMRQAANVYLLLDDSNTALDTYATLLETYPESPEVPTALLASGNIERLNGNMDNAMDYYQSLAVSYSDSEETQHGIFEAGMSSLSDNSPLASELFELSGTARGFLWAGNVYQQNQEMDNSIHAWQQATTVDPGTFFAMQSCAKYQDISLFSPSDTLRIDSIPGDDHDSVETWVEDAFGIDDVSSTLSSELREHPILQRATALWEIGLWSEARAEFDTLHKLYRDDPEALLQLAYHYNEISVYRSSVYAATRLIFVSEQELNQIPHSILRLAYPVYYPDIVLSLADSYDLDPLLVLSLMRQESSFDPTAQSPVGARGLMQLMPATAQDVADRAGWDDFVLDDLYRPQQNVELGVSYLKSILSFMDGNVAGALLGYNAGPGNALGWIENSGDSLEQLYDTVTFNESRLYLELIAENHTIYTYLYGKTVPDCMFEGIR